VLSLLLYGVEQHPVPDLPLCWGVLKHRNPLARRAHLPANCFYLGFLLMWCNLKFLNFLSMYAWLPA